MNMISLLVRELERENKSTEKLLRCVPDDQLGWRPHERSFTLGRLATHVAELPEWMGFILDSDEFDITGKAPAPQFGSAAAIADFFRDHSAKAIARLQQASEAELWKSWTFKVGGHTVSQDSKYDTIRQWLISHQVHHRGQLSVYLRLLHVAIPGMYGPSADDMAARQKPAAQV